MRLFKHSLIIVVVLFPLFGFSQINISPFLTSGYLNHLSRNGVNIEAGFDVEIIKRINISTSYRYSILDNNTTNEVEINALSLFLSYVIINKTHHRLLVGPGVSYGDYKRSTKSIGFEKEYSSFWFNPVKIRYDYIFSNHIKIGVDASLYGDDGDGSIYLGLLAGYFF